MIQGHPALNSWLVSKYFHTWNVILDPVLPAREVVVAYLNECGFSMFEPHEKGVLVYGGVEEVNEKEAEKQLAQIKAFASVKIEKQKGYEKVKRLQEGLDR